MPKYAELSVGKIWGYILQCPDMLDYFPDLDNDKLPERSFMFKILSTLRTQGLKQLLKEARECRSISNNDDQDQLVEMDTNVKVEIFRILPQKSNLFIQVYHYIASPGKAFQLLKKGAKLYKKKTVPKKYPANLNLLIKEEEEKD